MADFNITPELGDGLMEAQSAQEARDLLAAAGQELAEGDAERLWQEVERHRVDYGQELSEGELESLSGGSGGIKGRRNKVNGRRDKAKEGCAATVEPGSWCWSNDECQLLDVRYINTAPEKD